MAKLGLCGVVLLVGIGCDEAGKGDTGAWVSHTFSDLEIQTHDLVNEYRTSIGLPALELDEAIGAVARQHSEDMLSGAVAFGHDGFDARVETIGSSHLDAVAFGENVAFNQGYADPALVARDGWLASPTHLENIESGAWQLDGMGVAGDDGTGYYFTHLFVGL